MTFSPQTGNILSNTISMTTFIPKFELCRSVSPRVNKITKTDLNMSGRVEDKGGTSIEEGDTVFTKIRGGKREGEVRFPHFEMI